MSKLPKRNYDAFVFFSAGPVGDHAMILDFANRFYESTGRPSYILSKHPNRFLSDLLIPYKDHITEIPANNKKGYIRLAVLLFKSIFLPHCYVLVFAIPHPTYLKIFTFFIRFFTRSRIVGLTSLCGFKLPGGPRQSATFLGKGNYLPAHVDTQLFYEQANNLLEWLGYDKVDRPPTLTFNEDQRVLSENGLYPDSYAVFHLVASSQDKSLPPNRWNYILKEILEKFPDKIIVFSGAAADSGFIEKCIASLNRQNIINLCGKTNMEQLLTLYKKAKVVVSVHTGNAMLMNMLHLHTVMVNMKGVYMFKYHFNKNSTDCTGKGCECNLYERHCPPTIYEGNEYMTCVFNNDDETIIQAITDKLKR